jgi:PLP dependent protein
MVMNIGENIEKFKRELPEKVKLIAVSKTKTAELIKEAYDSGHKIFGENKVQEMAAKQEVLPKDIEWHLIGHLQTNKVKYIAAFVSLIHSVDSLKLIKEIDKQAQKNNRVIDCLLQVHIAQEETKFGLDESEVKDLINSQEFQVLKNVRLVGLMGMASFTENEDQVRKEFRYLTKIFNDIKSEIKNPIFNQISMGMSGDYKIAIEEGSTMVRIGSALFGSR